MRSSQPSGEPSVLRCPHCGAPVEAPPFAPATRCRYCGHTVQLGALGAARAPDTSASAQGGVRGSGRTLVFVGFMLAVMLTLSIAVYISRRVAEVTVNPAQGPTQVPSVVLTRPVAPKPKIPDKPAQVSYPMRSLLGISPTVDIDASRTHLLGLFPTITSGERAGELSYQLPLSHPWFSAVELNWKNEKDGRLVSVAFRPPTGDDKFKNQKEIADCLAKSLGKPEVRELNHLSGELSYFWGRHFPRAWADLYSGYLWLSFEDPKGNTPVTFAAVVRALDACSSP